MRALLINCTLKPSPAPSNSQALAQVVLDALGEKVEVESVRLADHTIKPGVQTDMGGGDEWPAIDGKLLAADILVVATPTWVGRPSSYAQLMLERMDAMLSETDESGRLVAVAEALAAHPIPAPPG